MHTGTGEIREFTDKEILEMNPKERKNWVPVDPDQLKVLLGMNREQRRKYYKENRKRLNWPTWEDVNGSLKEVIKNG
jgi:hypothetical protein